MHTTCKVFNDKINNILYYELLIMSCYSMDYSIYIWLYNGKDVVIMHL